MVFCAGMVEAVSVRDVYKQATGRTTFPPSLSVRDPMWEKQRKNNSSTLIRIYRCVKHTHYKHLYDSVPESLSLSLSVYSSGDQVEYFLPLVAGVCNNHNNLDTESSRNSSRSDWVLVCVNSRISVIRERDIHTTWTINSSSIHRCVSV